MHCRRRIVFLLLLATPWAILLSGAFPTPNRACADTYMVRAWQHQVERAYFVGILECEVGGQVTAKYRVIESWKGPPRGAILAIAHYPGWHMSSAVPATLPGERFLACVFYSDRGRRSNSSYGYQGRGHPYWCRRALTPLTFGHGLRPLTKRYYAVPIEAFGMDGVGVDRYRKAVLEHMSRSEAKREAEALRTAVRSVLAYRAMRDSTGRAQIASRDLRALLDLDAADAIVFGLISFASMHETHGRSIAEDVIRDSGGARALVGLRSPDGLAAFPGDTTRFSHLIRVVADRLPIEVPFRWPESGKVESLSTEALAAHRLALEGQDRSAFGKAFDLLTVHDPIAIAEAYERGSIPVLGESQILVARYQSASYFARKSQGDRRSVLRLMLKAQDPTVRVAGAVFLAMEDSSEGIAALRDLVATKGFPGFWAAVALASRGERSAMDHALGIFDWPVDDQDRYPYMGLENGIRVLLANSARSSHVKLPPSGKDMHHGSTRRGRAVKELRQWWAEVRDKIQLFDPWLDLYTEQRVE